MILAAMLATLFVTSASAESLMIEISKSEKTLRMIKGDEILAEYDVAVGSSKHPTPEGKFSINRVIWNPGWVPPPAKWAREKTAKKPGDPDNPMKRVKMFFKEPDYYIHGTAADVETSDSHGCIRMRPSEVTEVAKIVMEHGGKPMPEPWYRRVLRSRQTKVVRLADPVPVRITE
jgi:lipoprotein-anchoring transpeptidase ErfK/SrfK